MIVSLWLALRDTRVRLRVDAGIAKILLERQIYERVSQEPDFVIITVTNIGRRVVTVTGLIWKSRLIRVVFQMLGEAPLSAQIPARLQDGDQVSFSVPLEVLASAKQSALFKGLIPRPRWLTVRFLRMLVRTSTGEFVSAPLDKELRNWFLAFAAEKAIDDHSTPAKT